ncbi:leucine-rich repeat flightless-interacting protein 2-like protein [Dinothrombium tinctorium]|uniref:Leucine-rich repeat flightless-interacting protein 2-like protein n=1 Tax=Dinothrombium tinctorium TaxID=1965070 RepID=A0A3S3SNB1_9ACAR|nr:leucine-rich repeat flightless-interacting protein 2-like protein [Dinothrombium tinctorium]RWS16592.1 leucine-rich repeat flightless-interacting protein 2-like protein [Dinothrombium tinctorium]
MVSNAQLEKEKQCYSYQIEMLKDEIEEMRECNYRLQKDFKEKSRENGLVLITNEDNDNCAHKPLMNGDVNWPKVNSNKSTSSGINGTLISREAARILSEMEGETIEEKLRLISKEKQELLEEIKQLRSEVEEERQRNKDSMLSNQMINGIEMKLNEIETSKLIHEYKFRLIEAEQERNNLQNIIIRLETQLERLRQNAEQSEKLENDLKTEKRKVLRELREAQARIEDLETSNAHLQKRIDKFKSKCLATINSN